jgi:superfamily I DNA/RNA helicase
VTLSTSSILDGLSQQQARVVQKTAGHVLVVAGPGSGKTLTMVRRIAFLVS